MAEHRAAPLPEAETIAGAEMALAVYEGDRPSAEAACSSRTALSRSFGTPVPSL